MPRRRGLPLRPLPCVSEKERDDAKNRLIEEFKEERRRTKSETPTRDKIAEQAIVSACGRVVEAMRQGIRYEDVLARVIQAMDEELCRYIHDE